MTAAMPHAAGASLVGAWAAGARADAAEAGLHHAVLHLDLEAVAVGSDRIEIDALQRAPTKTLETAGRVADRHAGDPLDILRGAHAEHETLQRPVDHGMPLL